MKFDRYKMVGITPEDVEAIDNAIFGGLELFIDEFGRVFNEGGIYIADAKFEEI